MTSNYSQIFSIYHCNRIFRNKKKIKGKKVSINESITASRMENFERSMELHGFCNVWTNDGKIFCKLEDNGKNYFRRQMASVELGEKKKIVLGTGIFMGLFMKVFCSL